MPQPRVRLPDWLPGLGCQRSARGQRPPQQHQRCRVRSAAATGSARGCVPVCQNGRNPYHALHDDAPEGTRPGLRNIPLRPEAQGPSSRRRRSEPYARRMGHCLRPSQHRGSGRNVNPARYCVVSATIVLGGSSAEHQPFWTRDTLGTTTRARGVTIPWWERFAGEKIGIADRCDPPGTAEMSAAS